jgi:hypothetical protein
MGSGGRGEDGPVAVVLHHVAAGHLLTVQRVGRARSGTAITTTAQEVDADNARHGRDDAEVTRQATAEALRRNGATLATPIGSLEADELARSVPFGPAEGMEFSAPAVGPGGGAPRRRAPGPRPPGAFAGNGLTRR